MTGRESPDPSFDGDTLNTVDELSARMEETTLTVSGMACDGCEETVVSALESLEGVSSATANHAADEVRVSHDESVVDATTLSGTIEDAGYEVAG